MKNIRALHALFIFWALSTPFLMYPSSLWKEIATRVQDEIDSRPGQSLNIIDLISNQIAPIRSIVPPNFAKYLDNTPVANPRVTNSIPGYANGYQIFGTVMIDGKPHQIIVQMFDKPVKMTIAPYAAGAPNAPGINIIYVLPYKLQFSQIAPDFTKIDQLGITDNRIVFTTVEHRDPNTYLMMRKGLNILGGLTLDQINLKPIQTFLAAVDSRVLNKTLFYASIAFPRIDKSQFGMHIPLQMTIDYMEQYRQGKISEEPKTITKLECPGIDIQIAPKDLMLTGASELLMFLKSQIEPLWFRGGVDLQPTRWVIYGNMVGTYDPAFGLPWLGFGNLGVQAGIDLKAPRFIPGFPINVLGLEGSARLGTGPARIDASVAGGVDMGASVAGFSKTVGEDWVVVDASVTAAGNTVGGLAKPPAETIVKKLAKPESLGLKILDKIPLKAPQLGFYAKISKLGFIPMMTLFLQILGLDVNYQKIPTIELRDIELAVMPVGLTIGYTEYPSGILLAGKLQLGPLGGGMKFYADTRSFRIDGYGYVNKIDSSFFRLTGAGIDEIINTGDDGPVVKFRLAKLLGLPDVRFYMSGLMEVPFIGLSMNTDVDISIEGIYTKFDWKIFGGVGVELDINIPLISSIDPKKILQNLEQLMIRFAFKAEGMIAFKDKVGATLAAKSKELDGRFKARTQEIINNRDRRIKEINDRYNATIKDLEAKIADRERKAKDAEKEMNRVREECKKKAKGFRFWTKDFWKGVGDCFKTVGKAFETTYNNMTAEAARFRTQLADVRRDAGVKTQDVIKEVAPELEKIKRISIKVIDGVNVIVKNIPALDINKIEGLMTGTDLKNLKLPKVTIQLTFDAFGKRRMVKFELQIDFKNLQNSINFTSEEIIKGVEAAAEADEKK